MRAIVVTDGTTGPIASAATARLRFPVMSWPERSAPAAPARGGRRWGSSSTLDSDSLEAQPAVAAFNRTERMGKTIIRIGA